MNKFAALAALFGGLLLIWPTSGSDPSPASGDCLTQSYAADRDGRVKMLREMAATEFASDEAQAEWHLEQSKQILGDSFGPYTDAVAEAIVGESVLELAGKLENP